MTTRKKADAARRNGAKSKGPASPAGKAVSARNATRHGLFSSAVLLVTESASEYRDFEATMLECLRPGDALEALLCSRVITSAWRLRRVIGAEASLVAERQSALSCMNFGENVLGSVMANASAGIECLGRHESGLDRGLFRALHELQRCQALRAGKAVSLPICADIDVQVSDSRGRTDGHDPSGAKVP